MIHMNYYGMEKAFRHLEGERTRQKQGKLFLEVMVVIFIICSASTPVICADNEIYSSTNELKKVLQHESEVVQKLQEYLSAVENNMETIRRYIEDFNFMKTENGGQNVEIVSNPVNAFHILKRTVVDLANVMESIENHSKALYLAQQVMKKSSVLPTFDDFVGGSIALVGLQDTYGLNLSDVIHGKIPRNSRESTVAYELSARDCLFLGKAAFNKGLYDRALSWLEMALEISDDDAHQNKVTVNKDEILPLLERTKKVHDEVLEKKGPKGRDWQTNSKPLNSKLARQKKYQVTSEYRPKIYSPMTPSEENENFKYLCRKGGLRSAKLDAKLKCWYLRRKGSVSFIAPFKCEEISSEPHIVLYHDFMNESEMAKFRQVATHRLKRSLHQGPNKKYVATDIRISKQAWLSSEDGDFVNKVNQRISDATSLTLQPENEAAELFQVANYGMAGRYTTHTDYLMDHDHFNDPNEKKRGNRIGTFMIYLEDVDAGGATVFPFIGVRVLPSKGTAVFWWNLKTDGEGDLLTRHGACPVLYGQKWIANKWIRYNRQFQLAKCGIKGPASFKVSSKQPYT